MCRDATCVSTCRATLAWDVPQVLALPNAVSSWLAMGDLDGDGTLDAVSSARGAFALWRGQRDGRWESWKGLLPSLDPTERSGRVSLGDFDGDGRLDLLVALHAESPDSISVKRFLLCTSDTKGGFQRAGTAGLTTLTSVVGWSVDDMNGDGRSDIVVLEEKRISVWLGQADGSLLAANTTAFPDNLYFPLLADLNGDGKKDLVVASSADGELQVYLGSGHGELAPPVASTVPDRHMPRAAADTDGDGIPELLVRTAGGAVLVRGTKDGHLVDPRPVETDSLVYGAVFVDLDKDGRLDFIRSVADNELKISYGKADGSFGPPQRYSYPYSSTLFVDDVDKDGHADLFMHVTGFKSLLTFKGREGDFPGARIPVEEQPADVVWSRSDLVRADLNEDGVDDAIKLNATLSAVEITLGGADAGRSTVSYPASDATSVLAIDVDLDGHLDLAFPSPEGGTVTILLGRGDGGFDQRLSVQTGPLVGDFIAFSAPHPGRGRDLLFKRKQAPSAVLASTGRLCPSQVIEP